jgi:hypothetical protein
MQVLFEKPDDPQAGRSLKQALHSLGNLPIVGVLIKTQQDPDGQERVINWRFSDAQTAKSLALVLPCDDFTKE